MVTTNDDGMAEHIRLLKNQGMTQKRRYWHPVVGYNYRLTNIQAAIGLAQVERLEDLLSRHQEIASWYQEELQGVAGSLVAASEKLGPSRMVAIRGDRSKTNSRGSRRCHREAARERDRCATALLPDAHASSLREGCAERLLPDRGPPLRSRDLSADVERPEARGYSLHLRAIGEMLSPGASESTGDATSLANTTAVILAGGLGTRLRSVVPDRPKVLADVSGRPFIEYLLDQLVTESVQSVVLCTGYKGDQVQNRLGTNYRNMPLHYSREQYPLGTGGALRLALPMIESDPVLVLNGDSYCEARLAQFAAWHTARESSATILLSRQTIHAAMAGCRSMTKAGYVNSGRRPLQRARLDQWRHLPFESQIIETIPRIAPSQSNAKFSRDGSAALWIP